MSIRPVNKMIKAQPAIEGAGVRLNRVFGFHDTGDYDPFLLLDDFRGDNPVDYLKGFPSHPHRGIETITYMLAGTVEHGDSLGNRGTIGPGGVQWMTAGSGIIHEEMPKGDETGRMYGFQLWANLSAGDKMCAPRYQEFRGEDIPEVRGADGSVLRVICGTLEGTDGPVKGIGIDPLYADILIPGDAEKRFTLPSGRTAFAHVIEGSGRFDDSPEPLSGQLEAENRTLVLFSDGDEIVVRPGKNGVRFLLVSGRALKEPVAWYGPIVMNTREELQTAFEELEAGTFLENGS